MTDEQYMRLAIKLAERSKGLVSPNPLVGCVIVKNDTIVGEGWHHAFGKPHAEILAMAGVDPTLLEGATLYVNLEPCAHFGKTPPCAEAIIKNKIARVVFGITDPNPLVSGQGQKKLEGAGIEVLSGVLEEESGSLNRYFIKYITKEIPYIILKTAMSLDGFTAADDGESKWLTSEESRYEVHRLRSEIDAVLVGKNTVLADDPMLNVRYVNGRAPIRVVLDSNLEIPDVANVYANAYDQKTIVCFAKKPEKYNKAQILLSKNVILLPIDKVIDGNLDLMEIMQKLAKEHNIASILVEGGAAIHSSFLEKGLYDELHIFQAPIILGAGNKAFGSYNSGSLTRGLKFKQISSKTINDDLYLIYRKYENG